MSTSLPRGTSTRAALPRPETVVRPKRPGSLLAVLRPARPELLGLLLLAGVLYLWALSRNGWANDYYSAAVRSMSTSWHDFLYASLDRNGVMTVDKPPLALWVQALSVRAFGYGSLSILVPQALMGIASVGLLYDLVRSRFGRLAGFLGGVALAVTPITVAVSRHNNPDALLVLCTVAALWCATRALQAGTGRGASRWLVLAGICVGLGFETKMGAALTVVPGIAAAWLWIAPSGRGRLHALRQLLAGGGAMLAVGGAWAALVELTPAADRPWVSGTRDNSVLSLIFEYNGVGRVEGQAGGPRGLGGSMFGGSPGPLRLLNSALGGQAGWLLGFALTSGAAILLATRLRRSDPRSGWLIAVGGGFLVTAVLFSFAGGIFHPYYVALLAPFTAALLGAGGAHLHGHREGARTFGPLAVAVGVACELAVLSHLPGALRWLPPVLLVVGSVATIVLLGSGDRTVRLAALLGAVAVLMVAPAVWAVDTLGHAASGTFPEGGPGSLQSGGGPGGFPLSGRLRAGAPGSPGGFPGGREGAARSAPGGASLPSGAGAFEPGAGLPGGFGAAPPGAGREGAGPAGFGGSISSKVLAYVRASGGGMIAVSSQSSAARAIIAQGADVAGIGGFSGRESDPSVSWLAQEVSSGRIRWVLSQEGSSASGPRAGLPGDSRAGSRVAITAATRICRRVSLTSGSATAAGPSDAAGAAVLYDCLGRASALARANS